MILGDSGAYLGLLSFFSFSFSVIAAVLAIDMYTLLRTGELGKTWRVLIIASVMFALAQVVRMAELLNWRIAEYGLSQIIELVFVLALAYAFFLQRQTFTRAAALRGHGRRGLRRTISGANTDETDTAAALDQTILSGSGATLSEQKLAPGSSVAQPVRAMLDDADDALLPLDDSDDSEIEWSRSAPRKSRIATSGSLLARHD